jgi:signal transduction histidine kinase
VRAGEKLPLELEPLDLVRIASETLDELGTIHGDRFVLRAPPHIEGTWGAKAVRRILENLCNNAIKYGSPLAPVEVVLDADDDRAIIRVHNEGNPIPRELWSTLFEPFRRGGADAAQKGWGLGLTLVRGMAEAHGGSVEIESGAEAGTTFTVTLPRHARPA